MSIKQTGKSLPKTGARSTVTYALTDTGNSAIPSWGTALPPQYLEIISRKFPVMIVKRVQDEPDIIPIALAKNEATGTRIVDHLEGLSETQRPEAWGVQAKTDPLKGGPRFWVVNPDTLSALLKTAVIAATCKLEADAETICDVLNKSDYWSDSYLWHQGWKSQERTAWVYGTFATDPPERYSTGQEPESAQSFNAIDHRYAIGKAIKRSAGRILTIIEATLTNQVQLKAVKQLVKSSIRESLVDIERYLIGCNSGMAEGESTEDRQLDKILDND